MSGKKLMVVGTGTDVGKTYVSGLLLKNLLESGRRVGYFKPAMSGNALDASGVPTPGDALAALRTAGSTQPLSSACPFVYEHAVSPHLAARWEGRPFDANVAKSAFDALLESYDYVLVEGAGGVTCPLSVSLTDPEEPPLLFIDLMKSWELPCVLVADAGLGTINYVALTAWTLKSYGIPLKGIILNHWSGNAMEEDNALMCSRLAGAPVLARVASDATTIELSSDALASLFDA